MRARPYRGARARPARRALRRALAGRAPGEAADRSCATPSSAATPASTSKRPRRSKTTTAARSRPTQLTNSSLQGMVRGLRQTLSTTASANTSRRKSWSTSTNRSPAGSRGSGLGDPEVEEGLEVGQRLQTLARRQGGDRGRRRRRLGRGRVDRRASTAKSRRERIKGPEGTEVTIGVDRPRRAARTRELTIDPGGDRAAGRDRQGRARSTAASSATCGSRPSAKAPTPTCARRSKRSSAKAPKGSSSTCAPTAAACSTRRCCSASIFLPEDEVVVTTDSRTQGHAEYRDGRRRPAEAADGRPDRPQHGLRGGDPHRGARRRRRRRGGRHPLLRQGRLPAGGRPLQRRRAEADDRRVLHPRRRPTSPATGIHPDVKARDEPGRPSATRPSTAPSEVLAPKQRVRGRAARAGAAAARPPRRGQPRNAREAVEALLREELGAARVPGRRSSRGAASRRARPRRARRPAAT